MPETFSSLLSSPAAAREVSPRLFTAFPGDTAAAPYDRKAMFYDAIVGRSIYHRVFWGTSAQAFASFGRAALDATDRGCYAEIGCGSLLFTAPIYRAARGLPIVLADRSLGMLRRGLKRLDAAGGVPPEGVTLLHADAAALPVRSGIFSTILSLNVFHVPCDRAAIAAEFARTLLPGCGRLFVSCLVRSGRWSDALLATLHRAGELGTPFTLDELCETVAGRWAAIESTTVEGNMCFLVARHAG